MHATTATLSAALCGLTALSLASCDAHTLTARLPGASTATPPPGASQQDGDAADAAARERAREKGCDEPAGCYYGVRLVGYPIEEARRRALAYGYKGEITLDDSYAHDDACKAGTVCSIAPANWPVLGDDLTFYVNYAPRELKINKPE
jgi:hypothetical protein